MSEADLSHWRLPAAINCPINAPQVVVSPDAARAEAATAAAAEAAAAARREKHRAEKKLERAARKEAERRARKEQKHLERRAHLEKLALGCSGTSDVRWVAD